MTTPERWVVRFGGRPNPVRRLFCFPHAGGAATTYRGWPDVVPADVEVCALQLPGRERRLREEPIADFTEAAAAIFDAVEPLLDLPFVVFGHSMGALLGFDFARRAQLANRGPERLVVSGRSAPCCHEPDDRIGHLDDAGFMAWLAKAGGTPPEVLANDAMMELLLPALRADISICETYIHHSEPKLRCPITALGGSADQGVQAAQLAGWADETTGPFDLAIVAGDHFFVRDRHAVMAALATTFRWTKPAVAVDAGD